MRKSKLGTVLPKIFFGLLSEEQYYLGIDTVFRTTQSLLSDAELLLGNGRIARALYLTYIAAEELGKLPILTRIYAEANIKLWGQFRDHKSKWESLFNQVWIKQENNLLCVIDKTKDSSKEASWIHQAKLMTLYSDISENYGWQAPQDASNEEQATEDIYRLIKNAFDEQHSAYEKQILYIRH